MRYMAVLPNSMLHKTAVELYLRHRPDVGGWCSRCERPTCLVRQAAAVVIQAAGIDAALYDVPLRRPDANHWAQQPTIVLPVYRDPAPGGSHADR